MSLLFDRAPSFSFEEALLKKNSFQEYLGSFDPAQASLKQMRLVRVEEVSAEGDAMALSLLVDLEDGVIADVRFQVFGKSSFYLVLVAVSELVLLKSYPQAMKISSSLIENHLKKNCKEPFSKAFNTPINLALFLLDEALRSCHDIAVAEGDLVTPFESDSPQFEVPDWLNLKLKSQLEILEQVIALDIRPYIELDEGGIEIVSLKEGIFLTIGYKGACTTCHSSTGSTLTAIQQILRTKVFPAIVVVPDASWLSKDPS